MAVLSNQQADFHPLTDDRWGSIEPLFPKPIKRGRGKPHTPWRKIVNTVLYVYLTGSKWVNVPKGAEWGSKSAAHRWSKIWKQSGVLDQLLALYETTPESSVCNKLDFPMELFTPSLTPKSELIGAP